jgi:hypothetical protein
MSLDISYSGGVFSAPQAKSVGTVTAGTGPYNLANASYDSVSFSVASQTTSPRDMTMSSDGTKLYVSTQTGRTIYEYDLSTAWDLSTASYNSVSFGVNTQISTAASALVFSYDGTKLYVAGRSENAVYQYDLTTAWDISTASYASKSLDHSTEADAARGISISQDGTKFYFVSLSTDAIYQYTLSTANDISTASYDSKSLSTSSVDASPQGLFVSPDGKLVFICGSQQVHRFSLSTAFDISTGSFDTGQEINTGTEDTSPTGLYFKSDGSKMYVVGDTGNSVYQYSTGTATTLDLSTGNYFSHTPSVNTLFAFSNPPASGTAAGFALALTGANAAETYDIANASYDSKSFAFGSQDLAGTNIQFTPDGTKMILLGITADDFFEYSLSTAWDISTASYTSNSFNLSSQATNMYGAFFRSDGTKIYVVSTGGVVYQYSMSTAWDITTASYDSASFSVLSQAGSPRDLWFKPDGTKMYVVDAYLDSIYQYTLSTAWDVSSASYDSVSLSVSSQDTTPISIYFKPDGTSFWLQGFENNSVFEYGLTTAWDLSTASYSSISFSTSTQTSFPFGMTFGADGTKMYISDNTGDVIYQYSTGSTSTATFTYPSSVKFPSGIAPAGPAIDETDVLVFYTDDGGTTYQGFKAGDAMA